VQSYQWTHCGHTTTQEMKNTYCTSPLREVAKTLPQQRTRSKNLKRNGMPTGYYWRSASIFLCLHHVGKNATSKTRGMKRITSYPKPKKGPIHGRLRKGIHATDSDSCPTEVPISQSEDNHANCSNQLQEVIVSLLGT